MTTSFYIVLKRNNKNIICASESPSFLIIYNTIISYIKQKSIWKKEFFDKYWWIKSQFQPDFPFAILHGQKNGYSRLFFSMKYTKPIEKWSLIIYNDNRYCDAVCCLRAASRSEISRTPAGGKGVESAFIISRRRMR